MLTCCRNNISHVSRAGKKGIYWALSKLPTLDIFKIYSCNKVWDYFILMLIFLQDPKFLASANYQRSMEERKEDETALIRLKKQEEETKKQKYFQTKSSRHSRFGGSYTITNMKSISENPMIYHKPLSSLHNINFDENKRPKKISKNRETPKVNR